MLCPIQRNATQPNQTKPNNPAQAIPAQPSPAQPSPAQPSPAQPRSTIQYNPAQPYQKPKPTRPSPTPPNLPKRTQSSHIVSCVLCCCCALRDLKAGKKNKIQVYNISDMSYNEDFGIDDGVIFSTYKSLTMSNGRV